MYCRYYSPLVAVCMWWFFNWNYILSFDTCDALEQITHYSVVSVWNAKKNKKLSMDPRRV